MATGAPAQLPVAGTTIEVFSPNRGYWVNGIVAGWTKERHLGITFGEDLFIVPSEAVTNLQWKPCAQKVENNWGSASPKAGAPASGQAAAQATAQDELCAAPTKEVEKKVKGDDEASLINLQTQMKLISEMLAEQEARNKSNLEQAAAAASTATSRHAEAWNKRHEEQMQNQKQQTDASFESMKQGLEKQLSELQAENEALKNSSSDNAGLENLAKIKELQQQMATKDAEVEKWHARHAAELAVVQQLEVSERAAADNATQLLTQKSELAAESQQIQSRHAELQAGQAALHEQLTASQQKVADLSAACKESERVVADFHNGLKAADQQTMSLKAQLDALAALTSTQMKAAEEKNPFSEG